MDQGASRLMVRLVREGSDKFLLLLSQETVAARSLNALVGGLTPRETEVLQWVVAGKSNPEIGLILKVKRQHCAQAFGTNLRQTWR